MASSLAGEGLSHGSRLGPSAGSFANRPDGHACAQSLSAQMVSYLGRTGAPDLDKDAEATRVVALADAE